MPELPEVETVLRGLKPVVENRIVGTIVIHRYDLRIPIPADMCQSLKSRRIVNLERRGKYILFHFNNDMIAVLHLGMSGKIDIVTDTSNYSRAKHDHFILKMSCGTWIVYNDPRRFGMFYLLDRISWQDAKPFSKMGPEPLGNGFNEGALIKALAGKKCSIKSALLDQRVVAGLGNIYVCEALFASGVSPLRLAGDVTAKDIALLVPAIRNVLKQAIKAGGSTLKDYRKADGSLGYFQHQFGVYDRAGKECPGCICDIQQTGGVQRAVQSGRSSFYCPQVQV